MKIKHDDILIDENNPFANCKLGREKYAGVLTNIVATYAEGFVLAINNEWGTGKTTFVKMWQQHLKNQKYQTLYFNAWENDFDSNPLIALMAELKTLKEGKTEEIFKSLVKKGAIISKNVLPALAKALAAKYIDTQILKDAIENTTKAVTEILDDEIKEYTSKKEGLQEFKTKLTEFVKETKGNKPIVFIIDELDRCRPNYAVEVLEQIKHFFSVKGIVFVLSIDKVQLGNAVRGFYGSDRINADEYLRRFIDLEYTMPEPDTKVFCEYLYDYFEFRSFFGTEFRTQQHQWNGEKNLLITIASKLFESANLTLRQQEKIFAHTRIVVNSFRNNAHVFPSILVSLIFIKTYHHEFYENIKSKSLELESLLDEFSKIIPANLSRDPKRYFIHLEANYLSMYNNSVAPEKRKDLVEWNDDHLNVPIIKSKIDDSSNNVFVQYLIAFRNSMDFYDTTIEYFINKIDLTEAIEL